MRFKRKLKTIATLAACLLSGPLAAAGPAQAPVTTGAALDSMIEQRMNEAGMVGFGAAIIVGKKVVWMKGYGFADRQRAIPFTPHTIMNIGSVSKTFTGVALMRAVQEGKLSLDEDINRYLPFKVVNPSFPHEPITLRHLATHTSGITDQWPVYERSYHYGGDSPVALDEFLKSYLVPGGKLYAKDNFLNVKPGTHREYSNIAAGLAGYIVEIAVGEKLNVYTKRHIFEPLKMHDTGWFLSEIDLSNHSTLYISQGGTVSPIPLYGLPTYPDGGVRTSVADLSKFFIALLNEGEYDGARILQKPTVKKMLTFQYAGTNRPENVGVNEKNAGIFWETKRNVTLMGHGGSDPGVKVEMLSDLSKEVAVIVFSNTSLCDEEGRAYGAIVDGLWKHAASLKGAKQ